MTHGGKRNGAGAKPGNTNAVRHGFYSDVLSEEEQKLYEPAMLASLGDEIALSRIKLNRLVGWMQDNPAKVKDTHYERRDRMIGRIGDLEVKRSIIIRNDREAGAHDDSLDETLERFERSGLHRMTFKPKQNGKARNGT